jgi:hydrogenase maturation protease
VSRRVLLAGIGNIFLGDDGFGVEVATRLGRQAVPDGVQVADYGIRGVHLAYELLDGYDTLVLVDAVPMGETPGTLVAIEPEAPAAPAGGDDVAPVIDAHSMSPGVVLGMLAGLGGSVDRVVVVGCEPATLDEGIGLSPAVAAAIEPAVELCRGLLTEMTEPLAKDAPG